MKGIVQPVVRNFPTVRCGGHRFQRGRVGIGQAFEKGTQDPVFRNPGYHMRVQVLHFGAIARLQDVLVGGGAGRTAGEA